MSLINQGPTGVFTGPVALITRLCDIEIISATATFAILEFQFPSGEATEVSPTTITWPNTALLTLRQIKRFQLTAGNILVHFHPPK
jgi:hypothetical protein